MNFDLYQLVQIVYWIALATAFGGVLFIAVAAPVIFRVVREANPVLPTVLSVNLEGQHGTLLAGTIVSHLLVALARIELICGVGLLLSMIAQFFLIDLDGSNLTAMIIRVVMFVLASGVVIYDRTIVWPAIARFRQEYLDHADEPERANPAKDQFDREHRRSVTLLSIVLFLLLGMILFSANISPRSDRMAVSALRTTACTPKSLHKDDILSAAKDLNRSDAEILRFAQNDALRNMATGESPVSALDAPVAVLGAWGEVR